MSDEKIIYMTPLEAEAIEMTPIDDKIYMTKKGEVGEGWVHHGDYGFAANEMLDFDEYEGEWSEDPGDYRCFSRVIYLPAGTTAVKIVPKSGAQCFHDPNLWTVTIRFKTLLSHKKYSSNEVYGTKTTKAAAEIDWLNMAPTVLEVGSDRQVRWGGFDAPLEDNTGDKAYFEVWYQ